MLTLETLYAVLQGLPLQYLNHLDDGLQVFCYDLRAALDKGQTPLEAFRSTVAGAVFSVRGALIRMLGHMLLVKLSLVLQQDRSNLHKRMQVLVKKGYALKFLQSRGVVYISVSASLDQTTKVSINRFVVELMKSQPEELTTLTKLTTST